VQQGDVLLVVAQDVGRAALAGRPSATASASSTVDLPLPFSPTKKVMPVSKDSRPSARTAGMLNG
jgi:hypothetical protein